MKIFRRINQELNNLAYEILARFKTLPVQVTFDVPYVSQFSVPEHAEPTLKKTLAPTEDLRWAASGATSIERYADWALTMCGMASTSMVLEFLTKSKILPAILAENALLHDVYAKDNGGISDMRYRQYVDWVCNYGLQAKFYTRLSLRGIQHALSKRKLVIVSVNPNIRGFDTAPTSQKGGHLVVVTGYDHNNKTVTINNPSGFTSTNTQHNHKMQLETFFEYYAGRGIIISGK